MLDRPSRACLSAHTSTYHQVLTVVSIAMAYLHSLRHVWAGRASKCQAVLNRHAAHQPRITVRLQR